MRKNVGSQVICAQLIKVSDGAVCTAGTTSVYYTIDGGAQGTGTGSVTHEGQGCWSYVPTQAETNGDHVAFTFTNDTPAIAQTINVYPVSFDPTDAVRIGITALPNAAADAAGGLPISDLGGLDLDATIGAMVYTKANELDVNIISVSGSSTAAANHELVFDTDFATAYSTVNNMWNVTITGTPDVNAIQISGSTAAADNLENIYATNYSTVYDASNNKLSTLADVVKISGSTAAADQAEVVFDTDASTNYANNKWQTEADMVSISGSTSSADNLEGSTQGIVLGTVQTGTLSTTQFTSNVTEGTDDHYIGRTVIFYGSSTLAGQAAVITDYAGTGGLFTVGTMTEAPANGDTFVVI